MATAGTQGLKDTAKTFGEGVASRWGNANNFSKGFLNPTAIGAGTGMVAGGAYGGFSDNGSVLGGMAGGAVLGAGLGAGGYAGLNKFKFSQYTNPIHSNQSSAWAPGAAGPSSAWSPKTVGPSSNI